MAGANKKPAPSGAPSDTLSGSHESTVATAAAAPIESAASRVEAAASSLSTPVGEIQESLRKAVEKTVADTRAAYAKAKTVAEEATGALETSYSTAAKGIVEFNAKALDAMRANAEANFNFLKSAINVKSVSELVSLQNEHATRQVDALNAQAREIAALAQKVATDSVEPIKSQVAKTFKMAV